MELLGPRNLGSNLRSSSLPSRHHLNHDLNHSIRSKYMRQSSRNPNPNPSLTSSPNVNPCSPNLNFHNNLMRSLNFSRCSRSPNRLANNVSLFLGQKMLGMVSLHLKPGRHPKTGYILLHPLCLLLSLLFLLRASTIV